MSLFAQELIQKSDVSDILDQVLHGNTLDLNDCIRLLKSDNPYALGIIGNILREKLFGKVATFVNNIILNYTNVCITYCKFCAFYRAPGDSEGYTLSVEDVVKRVVTARDQFRISQVLMQGGHNPDLKIEYYEEAFRTIKEKCPDVAIHGLSASEIDTISKVERSSTKEVLSRLQKAGLDSLPGAGAEILDDNVKSKISPLKIISDIGTDGANYKTMEFAGNVVSQMSMEERLTLTNMTTEAGAKNGIIEPDAVTDEYIQQRTADSYKPVLGDDPHYLEEYTYEIEKLEPFVAKPYSP